MRSSAKVVEEIAVRYAAGVQDTTTQATTAWVRFE